MKVETVCEGALARQATGRLVLRTRGPGLSDFTEAAAGWLAPLALRDGLFTAFCRHTSASLTIQENADPDVRRDLLAALDHLAPRAAGYLHDMEGPDDMPAHIRAMLTGTSLSVPIVAGKLGLGTWQGLYLVEHRDGSHSREILLHACGA
jgi:secondary thiamine-phosphate synthase enzyme